jgi:bacteriocin biosynthesis cyclodehydratase domain-containing protein
MANTIRLTRAAALVGVGQFGERVCNILASEFDGHEEAGADGTAISAAFSSGARAVVLALWRPYPQLCEMADELSFRYLVPWLPVVMEHPVIRVGPLVVAPTGPCFCCYARRRAQHDLQRWATAVLQDAYDHDQGCGPRGYLPHHARMAAALAHGALGALAAGEPRLEATQKAGEVTTIRLVGGDLRVSHVISCHDCHKCGAAMHPVNREWLTELVTSLPVGNGRARPADLTSGPSSLERLTVAR